MTILAVEPRQNILLVAINEFKASFELLSVKPYELIFFKQNIMIPNFTPISLQMSDFTRRAGT